MAQKLSTYEGRRLYRLRQQTVEPVFGTVKSAMGFRQFLLAEHEKFRYGQLVMLAYNCKRLNNLKFSAS